MEVKSNDSDGRVADVAGEVKNDASINIARVVRLSVIIDANNVVSGLSENKGWYLYQEPASASKTITSMEP